MTKPSKREPICAVYYWNECTNYIEAKYKITVRDYSGRYINNASAPYQDFWHFIVDNCDVRNGDLIHIWNDVSGNDWQNEILALYRAEFLEKGEDALTFWVEW